MAFHQQCEAQRREARRAAEQRDVIEDGDFFQATFSDECDSINEMMSGTAAGDAAALAMMQLEPEMQTPAAAAQRGRGRSRSATPPNGRSRSRSEHERLQDVEYSRRRRASSAGARDNERRRERAVESARARADVLVDTVLEAVHDASGSTITANSRRLRTLEDGPAREEARADVAADIARYVHVPRETQAACVAAYAARAAPQMHVCGSCGLRDPLDTYGEVDLTQLGSEHALHVGVAAYERLCAAAPMQLLRRARGGAGYERVNVPRTLLHNLVEVDGHAYHVVREALRGTCIDMCSHCRRGFERAPRASWQPRACVSPPVSIAGPPWAIPFPAAAAAAAHPPSRLLTLPWIETRLHRGFGLSDTQPRAFGGAAEGDGDGAGAADGDGASAEGQWEDARAARALRKLRETRAAAKKAENEAKDAARKAANEARKAATAARRAGGRATAPARPPPPTRAPPSRPPPPPPPPPPTRPPLRDVTNAPNAPAPTTTGGATAAAAGGKRKVVTCLACDQEGHTARSKKCPHYAPPRRGAK
jgi:hypothetical protein